MSDDDNVFEHPLFGQHVDFVLGLQAAGLLFGAGPIVGRSGHGMTIIRVPAAAAADYVTAAQDDDLSVADGRLRVDVDVWGVRMTSRRRPSPAISSATASDFVAAPGFRSN